LIFSGFKLFWQLNIYKRYFLSQTAAYSSTPSAQPSPSSALPLATIGTQEFQANTTDSKPLNDKILPSGLLLSFQSHPVATTLGRFRLIFWNLAKVAVPLHRQNRE